MSRFSHTEDSAVEEVVAAIRAAAAGEALISPPAATVLLVRIRDQADAPSGAAEAHLSRRELQVLGLLSEGKANLEVAQAPAISGSTVRRRISSILLKFQVDNRVQAKQPHPRV